MDEVKTIPFVVHEGDMARMERMNKRLFIIWLITFLLLVGCVAGFIWYESQWVDEVYTIESSADGGGTAIANATGEVNFNGESKGNG